MLNKNEFPERHYFCIERYICDVFSEMRKCVETHNFSYLSGLIEEAQCLANRMEAALEIQKKHTQIHEDAKKLEKAYKEKYAEYVKLQQNITSSVVDNLKEECK